MLYYCPLESYPERYTQQLAAADFGWLEFNWRKAGIEYRRVPAATDGRNNPGFVERIKDGKVLDGSLRSISALQQCVRLLEYAREGTLTDEDVIFFDDFWHPGISGLAYTLHQMNLRPKMYAHLYAQSVDEFDFTAPMKQWIRPFEVGIGRVLDGVFVANTMLKELVNAGGISTPQKTHVTGLIFDSESVAKQMDFTRDRLNTVIFSSRCDAEKNPLFFLKVARLVLAQDACVRFVFCTSRQKLTQDEDINREIQKAAAEHPNNILIETGLTKSEYYAILCSAKVQFNCADQDWVSYTLLESSVAGCLPVYPDTRSFPETFTGSHVLYPHKCELSAAYAVRNALSNCNAEWMSHARKRRAWLHTRFDYTWKRQAAIMGLMIADTSSPYESYGDWPAEVK